MTVFSRAVSVASSAVLLGSVPELWRYSKRRNRRRFQAQLQLVFLWLLFRRLASLRPIESRLKRFPPVAALEGLFQSAIGSLVAGAVVPALLALAGMPFLLGRARSRHRRWLARVLICGSVPTLADALEERFGEEVDTIAVLAFELGLLMGEHGAAAVILLMLSGGEALEHYVFVRARKGLEHVLDRDPPVAHRMLEAHEGAVSDTIELEDVDARDVQCGDVLLVRAGEVVPVDGKLLGGEGDSVVVDEGMLTGEAGGTGKAPGDTLLSGSVAYKPLRVRASTPFEGSTLELMRQALQDALERKGQLQLRSTHAAEALKPMTLAVAAAAMFFRRRSASVQRQWTVVLSVLMAATPCPALIGVPVAFLSGMSVAARHGVLVKSGSAIESLASASHVVLDKTGTLTQGVPRVTSFEVCGDASVQRGDVRWREALQLVASAEVISTHPLAVAIRRLAEEYGLELLPAKEPEHAYGFGVAGVIAGRRVAVGSLAFLKSLGLGGFQEGDSGPVADAGGGLLEVYFHCRGTSGGEDPVGDIVGRALLEDPVREGSATAVARLRALGLRVSILSGDRSQHLGAVAKQVGVDDAVGGCLPQEKAQRVQDLAAKGRVIMVGDEGNDAPALAAAHVGISVGTASALASQSADVVVSPHASAGALERIVGLVVLSRVVVSTAGRGVRCGLGLSALQVAAAGTGRISPNVNAVLQELVDVSALANASTVLMHRWA